MKAFLIAIFSCILMSSASAQEKPEGLFINSKAPEFKAQDQGGVEVSLKDLRKKGNVVVVFYRGSWCPYCSRYLKKLQDSLEVIRAAGASVVVITPQAGDGIDTAVARSGATFPVLHDENNKIANGYKVAYKVDERTFARYKNAGIDLLEQNQQKKEAYLPVPAVYIVNNEGSVTFRYFEEDYKKRLLIKDLIAALKGKK